jgi:hypothetical protein
MNGRKEDSPNGIADGCGETPLQRLTDKLSIALGGSSDLNPLGFDELTPVHVHDLIRS